MTAWAALVHSIARQNTTVSPEGYACQRQKDVFHSASADGSLRNARYDFL